MSGRPSSYTQAIAAEICGRLMAGESLRMVCQDEHLPDRATVHRWVIEDREGFYDQYTRARQAQALLWAEEILDLSDSKSDDVARSRLQVDTRKWLLSKVLPKVYGDRVSMEHSGPQGQPIRHDIREMTDEELVRRARQLTNRLSVAGNGNGSHG